MSKSFTKKIIIFFSFLFVLLVIYAFSFNARIGSMNNFIGESYAPSDDEINYISTLKTFNKEGLYKSVSNVYPPGRFLVQAVFFKFLGASIPTSSFYFSLPELLFPVFLFFLSFLIFRKYKQLIFSSLLAILTTFIYLSFINSAQDVHVLAALFFIVLLSNFRSKSLKNIILGVLIGAVFLFRIEAGVFLLLSIIISNLYKKEDLKGILTVLFSFFGIWLPVLIYIFFTGSLKFFILDTLCPGLINQPKLISIPIPPHLSFVFFGVLIFLFSTSLSLYIKSKNHKEIRIFAIFSILSFAAALVRSDEGHLWYGAVWLPVYISYFILQIFQFKKYLSKKLVFFIIPMCILIYIFGYFIIKLKSVPIFVILTLTIFWFFTYRFKKNYSFLILISGVIVSVLVFHSLSFIRLRFIRIVPHISLDKTFVPGLFQSKGNEIAGLEFSKSNIKVLEKIKQGLDSKNKWLFIYPDHVIFYDYFKYKNPTRYYYFAIDTTNEIQKEIITILEKTKTNNFIFFPDEPASQKIIRQWILKNTFVDQIFIFGKEKIELRKKLL